MVAIVVVAAGLLAFFVNHDKHHDVRVLYRGVIDAGTFRKIDYSYEDKLNSKRYDNWGGCTAVATRINDNTIIGRNMDLTISDKAAYVFKTDIYEKYKTLNLAYTYRDYAPDFFDAANDLNNDFYNYLPFISDDILNEKGLYIEVNMRNAEASGFASSGTNPNSKERTYIFSLPIYLGLNAANIDEALSYLDTLNIYTKDGYWNYAFLLADATGRYGVLEFSENKWYWNENQNAQANFYITPELNEKSVMKTGVGRYNYVREHVKDVTNKEDMFNLMNSVKYSKTYDADALFDVRSEYVGVEPHWTYDYVMDSANTDVIEYIEYMRSLSPTLSRDDRKPLGAWESSFKEVVDINRRSIDIRFFEDDEKRMTLYL